MFESVGLVHENINREKDILQVQILCPKVPLLSGGNGILKEATILLQFQSREIAQCLEHFIGKQTVQIQAQFDLIYLL